MNISIINTGGTFNKRYNPIKGLLEVPNDNVALEQIIKSCPNINFEIINIISKDSLDIDNSDRELLYKTIKTCNNDKIIVIHGTDTIDKSSQYLEDKNLDDKKVIFTGAMVPMSIKKVEASVNFAQAIGFLNAPIKNGIYISMHGIVTSHKNLIKNREIGQFELNN